MTRVLKCSCENSFQDLSNGFKNRVHNLNEKGDKATCTVCGKVQQIK